MVAKLGVTAVDMRQIWNALRFRLLFFFAGRILSELMLVHVSLGLCGQVRDHAADRKEIIFGRPWRRPEAGRPSLTDRLWTMSMAASKAFSPGASASFDFCSSAACLQDHFQIDRHRMIAGRNHVFLVHVAAREAVEQRKPGAGTPEKSPAALLVGASALLMNSVQP